MSAIAVVGDAVRIPLPDKSVDLVFGSPPYQDARTYGIGASRKCQAWVDWMLRCTEESLRVTRGAVLWVVAGVTRQRNYQPGPEGLLWEAHKRGWLAECPCYWRRVGIPGSGGDQWFRKDVEYVLCFKAVAKLPWSDNTAMGGPPKYGPGGGMSRRKANGDRASHGAYVPPKRANPGNLINTGAAGGGNIGSELAHENEAPFPEELAEWFICALCQPGGVVLDPFSGAGTTVATAKRLGRDGIGVDIRLSQAVLTRRRIEEMDDG